jgi:hypothetical protein
VCLLSQPSSMPNQYSGAARKRGFKYFLLKGLIEVDGECWIWLGAQTKDGYGNIRRKARAGEKAFGRKTSSWKNATAHNYFYELYHRLLNPEEEAGHTCHRRLCVRPKHLRAMTHPQNMRDMFEDMGFNAEQKNLVATLLQEGLTPSRIAFEMKAPRPYIIRLAKELNWRELDFGT